MDINREMPQGLESEPKPELHILGAEDDPSLRELETLMFRRLGIDFQVVPGGQEGLDILNEAPDRFNVVISDRDMEGMNGEEFLSAVKKLRPGIVTALITGREFSNEELGVLRSLGVDHYLQKPYSLVNIEELITQAQNDILNAKTKNPHEI